MPTTHEDIHTSDLTANCLRAVQLRLDGKILGETGQALFKGNLAHEALGTLHKTGAWDKAKDVVRSLVDAVLGRAKREGYPPSQSVRDNASNYADEVCVIVENYARRVAPIIERERLIGVELPVRMTATLAGREVSFASHLDLTTICTETDSLVIRDWKLWDDSPTPAYLNRNLQMALYWLMGKYGEVCVDESVDAWRKYDKPIVRVEWINLSDLRPYTKKTPGVNDNGEPVMFEKGDDRPLRNVIRRVPHKDANEDVIWAELELRVRMRDAGAWPTNPDPVGCQLCQSKMHCPTFAWRSDDDE